MRECAFHCVPSDFRCIATRSNAFEQIVKDQQRPGERAEASKRDLRDYGSAARGATQKRSAPWRIGVPVLKVGLRTGFSPTARCAFVRYVRPTGAGRMRESVRELVAMGPLPPSTTKDL